MMEDLKYYNLVKQLNEAQRLIFDERGVGTSNFFTLMLIIQGLLGS
jgi:hypothetical protein